MKKRLALLLAGLLLLTQAGCGLPAIRPAETPVPAETAAPAESAEPGPAVTLTLGTGETDDRLDDALDRLRRTLPDIALTCVPLPAPGETQPDLLLLGESAVADYAAAGLLTDLSGEAKAAALLEALSPAERAEESGGKLWALPERAAGSFCFFANDALFSEAGTAAPQSFDELPAAAAALKAQGKTALALCLDEDEAALALLEAFLWAEDGRGLTALFRGERSPYDEAFLRAADRIYRLGRADAASLLSPADCEALWYGGEAAMLFAREDEAARSAEALGEGVRLLPCRAVRAGESEFLALSAASEHPALALDAACLLCGYLAEYDLRVGCGARLAYPTAAGEAPNPLAEALAARHAADEGFTRLVPESEPALAAVLADGVRQLLRGSMLPEELVELAAIALER